MIDSFSNIDVKSYNNYSNTSDTVGKANILFGTKYVLDNIDVVDDISGIRLTVGKEAIDNKEAIFNVERANENIELINANLHTEKNIKKQQLYTIMQSALSNAKTLFSII